MVPGVKITLLICFTVLLSCFLAISYNEYVNRYIIITASDNSLYIFDKKSTVLNHCVNDQCSVINTKLPQSQLWQFNGSSGHQIPAQQIPQNIPQMQGTPIPGSSYSQSPIITSNNA